MPSTTAYILTAIVGAIALVGLYVYFFGIPPELKREMEKKALETMGENKASYVLKGEINRFPVDLRPGTIMLTYNTDQISKLPASDQEDVKQLKKGLGNALGGALKNPLGDKAGDAADDASKPFTGR
jgi:hypothetical protein